MEKHLPITEAEWKIIKLLWEQSPMTMPELTKRLEPETGWSKHTVITLLKRMLAKGTVRVEESEPARLYYPLIERTEAVRSETNSLVRRVFGGSALLLVNELVSQGELSESDIAELMATIEKAKEHTP
jgi:BlaI family penicillinase repressor